MNAGQKIVKVIIVDDSPTVRQMLTTTLESDPGIMVVATAEDPLDAREKIKLHNPDVLTLDIEMPKMNGLEFLEKIMRLRPMPVVMVSSLTQRGADATITALELGAVDYVPKPNSDQFNDARSLELIEKIKFAARVNVASLTPQSQASQDILPSATPYQSGVIMAIGSSTGGVEALKMVIPYLPSDCPPVVITQHMPPVFTESFAKRLDSLSVMKVVEAKHGITLEHGCVYIAPGGYHLRIRKRGSVYMTDIADTPSVSGHKPSVDVLFESVAQAAGDKAVGAILTGMGRDGADGLLKLRKAGARTFGQDEHSSIVYGMPKMARQLGAVEQELPIGSMAKALLQATSISIKRAVI